MLAFLLAPTLAFQTQDISLSRFVYPLSKPIPAPEVVVDATDFPEGRKWGEAAAALVRSWYPHVTSLLATETYRSPKRIRLIIRKEIGPPAYASGGDITINGKWIAARPDDLGMVIHELTHVVQQYPDSKVKPGWLVEGIADYIRWWRYEPELHAGEGRTRVDPEKSKYTDSYRTTGMWLAWVSRKYDMGLVPALDSALRKGEDPIPVFAKLTGKEPGQLWTEFLASQR